MEFKTNNSLPLSSNYEQIKTKVKFWQSSYKVDEDYLDGENARGEHILVQLPCEELRDYEIRKKISETRNYTGPIVNKYVGSIFRTWPDRSDDSIFEDFNETIDGGIHSFMRDTTTQMLIQGRVGVGIGINNEEDELYTLKLFNNEDILNVETEENKPIAVLVNLVYDKNNNEGTARYYDKDFYQDIKYEGPPLKAKILEVGKLIEHGMADLPFIIVEPILGSSFVSPIANSQVKIINLLSLLSVEIVDNTFTRWIISGVRDLENDVVPVEGVLQDKKPITWSTKRIMTFEETEVTPHRLGADTNQATSIRESVKEAEEHLYRAAGVGANYNIESGGEQSGLSRLVQLEDFSIIANHIIQTIQKLENQILEIVATTNDQEYIPTTYSTDVLDEKWSEEIAKIRDIREFSLVNDKLIAYLLYKLIGSEFDIPEEMFDEESN